MNRRDLFKVVFSAGVAAAVPAVLGEALPTIYGDGVHDDTEGLQAAINRKPFHCLDGCVTVRDGFLRIQGGSYRVSGTLDISNSRPGLINACHFTWIAPDLFESGGDILRFVSHPVA